MSTKKLFALVGSLLIMGLGFAFAGEQNQAVVGSEVQKNITNRFQLRTLFVDENGDGICDFYRDHNNNGMPNCQDQDWERPEDGTGDKNRFGNRNSNHQFVFRNGSQGRYGWSNQSFSNNQSLFGSGVCDRTGPKGNGYRGGKH